MLKPAQLLMALALCVVAPLSASAQEADAALQTLLAEAWEARLQDQPLFATEQGDSRYNGLLPDDSPQAATQRYAQWRDQLAGLSGINRDQLSAANHLNAELFEYQLQLKLQGHELRHRLLAQGTQSGFLYTLDSMVRDAPAATAEDYRNYLKRLRALPVWVDQKQAQLEQGMRAGMVRPGAIMPEVQALADSFAVQDPQQSVFWMPFADLPSSIDADTGSALLQEARSILQTSVLPRMAALATFFREQYTPAAAEQLGASALPNGEAYYNYLVRYHTTLPITAEEVHEIGQSEVARIRGDMETLLQRINYEADLASFIQGLRSNPKYYAKTPEQLLMRAAYISKTIDGELPSLFGRLPRQPYTVKPVPDHLAPTYTSGRYVGGAIGSEPGTYWVNTYDLPSRPLFGLPALTAHEAVPGHHLQIALSKELTDLPPFRRELTVTAFTEGWALYSEYLGIGMGIYEDAYDEFGRLTFEMWRACRLAVDTGIHAKGWSRQQAIDFMAANTGLSLKDIQIEVDRYISWPGQALGYKMGELKIRELRARAENALGNRFNIRDFHDQVLVNGPIPLPLLERHIDQWIAGQSN